MASLILSVLLGLLLGVFVTATCLVVVLALVRSASEPWPEDKPVARQPEPDEQWLPKAEIYDFEQERKWRR